MNLDQTEYNIGNKNTKRKMIPLHIEQRVDSNTGISEYHCTICQKSFRSRTQKYYHYGCTKDELKKHKCEICEKSFATRSHFAYHMETHSNTTYRCQDCGKSFTNRIVFQKHMKIHKSKNSHLCEQCNKEFKNKETLAAHIARHNNVLDFQCNICSTKYATNSALQQHKLSHFAKKHECPQCGKRFQRNSILSLHLKRHTKTDKHFCNVCFKKFSDIAALQRHTKMHKTDGITKYRCVQCDIITARKDNMQRHVRNMHIGEHFSDCTEIVQPSEDERVSDGPSEGNCFVENVESNERYIPKTIANSSVIKCIGNVEPVKVPNTVPEVRNPEVTVSESVRPKMVHKKYDPIEMYRKIIGTEDDDDNENEANQEEENNEQMEAITNERGDTIKAIEKPRSANLNISNFSETHWRKNFKYTYQHQEY